MNNRVFEIDSEIHRNLIVKSTGKIVSENEPVYVLRACDNKALATIRVSQSNFAPTSKHWKIIQDVIDDFTKFRKENPELMKEPEECY